MKASDNLFDRATVSQTERAYVVLEELIVTGELPPGSHWSEIVLSERLGIGRSPIRGALQKLAFQRLVHIVPRQGISISEIDYQGQLQVIQTRREIERLIVAQASHCASGEERDDMAKLIGELEKLKIEKNMRTYMRLHFNLTKLVGEASRNSYAAEFYGMLQTLARRFLYFHHEHHSNLTAICDLHIDQLKTIISGNSEAAIIAATARNDHAENLAKNILMELINTSAVTILPKTRKS